jgi:hypothetical protein
MAELELVRTTEPPLPASIMGGTATETVFHTPVRLTASTVAHSRSEICQNGAPGGQMPALGTTMSSLPNSSMTSETTAARSLR